MNKRQRLFCLLPLLATLFLVVPTRGGGILQQPLPFPTDSVTYVELRKAGELRKREGFDAQIFKDNVVFYHEGAFMYCDSAYLYKATNSFEAFSNVRMEQGDTIFVYGDYLYYDGNTQLAQLRKNIRMEDRNATLFTDSLNYDRVQNLGYYFDGGMLVDDQNELTSFWGQYSPESKEALFSDSVKLINPDYTIFSDTLKYNTETKVADILGPSVIRSDSGFIHTKRGWYNTTTDDAHLYERSEIYSKDSTKLLIGDTIHYNRQTGIGEVYGHMFLNDMQKKSILKGNYGLYNEQTEYGFATDSAYVIDYSQSDSLFLHGDSLIMQSDSIYRDIHALHNVRFYRHEMQGVCDSMRYLSRDSVLNLIGDPVIWNGSNQVLGDKMDVFLNDSTIDKVEIKNYSLAIQARNVDNQYNQLSGSNMTISFRDGEMRHLLVEGNAQSRYYIPNEDSTFIIGLNKTESPYLSMDIENDEIQKIKLWAASQAVTIPLPQLKPDESKLKGFVWLDYLRPRNKKDIFRSNERKSEDNVEAPTLRFTRPEEEESER